MFITYRLQLTCYRLLIGIALIALTSTVSPVFANDGTFQSQSHATYAQSIEEYKIPGLVVGVTLNGHHSFYATGLASRANNSPNTPDTLFELGSISKAFN
ncbi:serine hydrolase [Candidimonas humi]|nr:serine hydrolase [Candidimonas humi]